MEYGMIRAIEGDTIISPSMPRLGVRISPEFVYLGDLQYLSNETFHVEEFICLSPNGLGHVTRLLLVHFAGFLENREGEYRYESPQTVTLDGETYLYQVEIADINDYVERFPGSDLAHAVDYIRQRAYTLAGDMVFQRFIRLVSPDRRNEFIVYVLERNTDPALTPQALEENAAMARALLDRALDSFTILH